MKKTILILLIILLKSCSSSELNTEFDANFDVFLITYHESLNWINYEFEATLDQNGEINSKEFDGTFDTLEFKTKQYTISEEDLKEVKQRLNDLTKISLSKQYGFDSEEEVITDQSIRTIKYITEQKTEEISLYYPRENEMPQELELFIQLIERLIR
jgi:hypothetical protein